MTEETYGPPIPANGKRPDWLDADERIMKQHNNPEYPNLHEEWQTLRADACSWRYTSNIRLKSDHPYYQSAEYKASVGQAYVVAGGPTWASGTMVEHDKLREAQATLEAAGYTVTPPDPLAELHDIPDFVVPKWALDKAANMAGWDCWAAVPSHDLSLCDSIAAHGETICKHETPPDPLAADREFLAGLIMALDYPMISDGVKYGQRDKNIPAAMEYLRQNKGRL